MVRNRFKHIDKGCLSDPEGVNVFRINPKTGKVYTCRGTGTNERDNLDLSRILSATHIGLHRAERLIHTFFEGSNDRKRIRRRGEDDHGTVITEKIAAINSRARDLGIWGEELPCGDVTMPSCNPSHPMEDMGFSYRNKDSAEVSNPTTAPAQLNAEDVNETAEVEMASFLAGVGFGKEEDNDVAVEVDLTEDNSGQADRVTNGLVTFEESIDQAIHSDEANRKTIEAEIARLLPSSAGRETSVKTFERLAQDATWIPFRRRDSTVQCTEIDAEESRLFQEFMTSGLCDPNATPGARRGFHKLRRAGLECRSSSSFQAVDSGYIGQQQTSHQLQKH